MNDIRSQLLAIVDKAKTLHASEHRMTLESINLIASLAHQNAAGYLGLSQEGLARSIGITSSVFFKRLKVWQVVSQYPEARTLVLEGHTEISTLGLVAATITPANAQMILNNIAGRSRREVSAFFSRVNPDGSIKEKEGTIEVSVTFTESEWAEVQRAREVLSANGKIPKTSDVLLTAIRDSLAKRDPVQKAERAVERAAKKGVDLVALAEQAVTPALDEHGRRTPVPSPINHALALRDGGQCTWILEDGTRCPERHCLENDHRIPIARGGRHRLRDMAKLCRSHNQLSAEMEFGRAHMAKARELRSCTGARN